MRGIILDIVMYTEMTQSLST